MYFLIKVETVIPNEVSVPLTVVYCCHLVVLCITIDVSDCYITTE